MTTLKTHTELGLTLKQYNALVQVSGKLARGELKHYIRRRVSLVGEIFDMNTWLSTSPSLGGDGSGCGTIGCLGGWATHIAKDYNLFRKDGYYKVPIALHHLFHPPTVPEQNWFALTPQQAGAALCHYLTTGEDGGVCWTKALKK